MQTPPIDVNYIARLARLRLTEDETARFTEDITQVLAYVDLLNRWDTEHIEPMCHPLPASDALREDTPRPGLSTEQALMNAPQSGQNQIRVPKVVESA